MGHVGIGKIVLAVAVICIVALAHQAVCTELDLHQDINGYLDRAEAATTAGSMAEFISSALDGLEKWDITDGNWSMLATRNPNSDGRISYEQLSDLRNRLIEIDQNEDISSIDYALSMEEVKTSFSNISMSAYELYTKKYAILIYPPTATVLWILLIVFGIWIFPMVLWNKYLIKDSVICKIKGHNWEQDGKYVRPYTDQAKYVKLDSWTCDRCEETRKQKRKPYL